MGARHAPKDPAERRRRNKPERGEWVDLTPLEAPVLPEADPEWSPRVIRLWEAWRADPVSTQWGEADLAAVRELAEEWDCLKHTEQRLRMDGFGLTPKGKRDLRWRTVNEVATIAAQAAPPKVRRLRVVADD